MTYLSDSLLLTFLMKWWDYVVLRECESFLSVQRDSLNRTQRQSPRRRRWCTQGVRLGEDDIVDIIRLLVVVLLNYVFPHWTIFLSPAVVEVKCSPQSRFRCFSTQNNRRNLSPHTELWVCDANTWYPIQLKNEKIRLSGGARKNWKRTYSTESKIGVRTSCCLK